MDCQRTHLAADLVVGDADAYALSLQATWKDPSSTMNPALRLRRIISSSKFNSLIITAFKIQKTLYLEQRLKYSTFGEL
jgi:hypothetical protein